MDKIEKLIKEYPQLSAEVQLESLQEFSALMKSGGIYIENGLSLLMYTKVDVFAVLNNKDIKNLFSDIHETVNIVSQGDLKDFIKHLGEAQKVMIIAFLSNVLDAGIEYNNYCKRRDEESTDNKCSIIWIKYLLSDKMKYVKTVYLEYKDNPNKPTISKLLEMRRDKFNETADKYKCRSGLALGVAVISFLSLLGFGMFLTSSEYFHNSYDDRMNYFALVSFIGGKILVATTLFFALAASVRVYFAFSHNETICRHRKDVLDSYEFVYTVAEDKDKNLILTKVTDAVFTQLPTGFSKLQSDEGKSSVSLDSISNLLRHSGSSSNP